jgi:hypothetical protein
MCIVFVCATLATSASLLTTLRPGSDRLIELERLVTGEGLDEGERRVRLHNVLLVLRRVLREHLRREERVLSPAVVFRVRAPRGDPRSESGAEHSQVSSTTSERPGVGYALALQKF